MLWSPVNPMTQQDDGIRGGPNGQAERVANDFSATSAPSVSDDSTNGYAVGSVIVDTTNGNVYICEDASPGAAVWLDLVTV